MPFVVAAIVLYFCAAVTYGFQRDWVRVVYWVAAAVISWATLTMKK